MTGVRFSLRPVILAGFSVSQIWRYACPGVRTAAGVTVTADGRAGWAGDTNPRGRFVLQMGAAAPLSSLASGAAWSPVPYLPLAVSVSTDPSESFLCRC